MDAAKNLGTYITKIDFKSNPYKGNLVELNCKLIIEAPENIKNKMRSEIVMAIVFKIIDTKLTPEEIKKKIVLVTIPSENFDFIKSVVTDLFQNQDLKTLISTKKLISRLYITNKKLIKDKRLWNILFKKFLCSFTSSSQISTIIPFLFFKSI